MPNLRELPDVLRRAGLTVVTHDGWETRTTNSPSFSPSAVIWHHDASAVGDSPGVPGYMLRNWLTAGAQLWVSRQGVWHVLSCNKANHAGLVLPGKPGNSSAYGVETDHTVGEDWPDALTNGLRVGTAALLQWLGVGADRLEFHKSVCAPPGRKVDPDGLNLAFERGVVDGLITGRLKPLGSASTPAPAAPAQTAPVIVVPTFPAWPGRVLQLGSRGQDVRDWQARMRQRGWTIDIDGIFGNESGRIVRAFQAEKRLAVDGRVGRDTWNASWTSAVTA